MFSTLHQFSIDESPALFSEFGVGTANNAEEYQVQNGFSHRCCRNHDIITNRIMPKMLAYRFNFYHDVLPQSLPAMMVFSLINVVANLIGYQFDTISNHVFSTSVNRYLRLYQHRHRYQHCLAAALYAKHLFD